MSQTYLRGDLYYADLGEGIGSEQKGYRPVVIIQNNVVAPRPLQPLFPARLVSRLSYLPKTTWRLRAACKRLLLSSWSSSAHQTPVSVEGPAGFQLQGRLGQRHHRHLSHRYVIKGPPKTAKI